MTNKKELTIKEIEAHPDAIRTLTIKGDIGNCRKCGDNNGGDELIQGLCDHCAKPLPLTDDEQQRLAKEVAAQEKNEGGTSFPDKGGSGLRNMNPCVRSVPVS